MKKEIEVDSTKKIKNGLPPTPKDPETIKKAIENIQKGIDYHKKRLELTKKQYELMIKYPKVLKPSFEYEEQDEWIELAKGFHELQLQSKIMEIEGDMKGLEDHKKISEKMLEDN